MSNPAQSVASEAYLKLVAYQTHARPLMQIVAAPPDRYWMDETTGRFAYRCLPLLIANQSGWYVLNSHQIRVTWDGSEAVNSVTIESQEGSAPFPASSHFGHGIVTWTLPYLFRTPPGYNLLVRGPANWPKDGAYPLEGVVETDWAVANFTMNWKLTRPGMTITFAKGEPVCMIVPQRRGEIESFDPQIRWLDENPELAVQARDWAESRRHFLEVLSSPGPTGTWTETWQKHYFQGTTPEGGHSEGHQTRLKLRQFSHSTNKALSTRASDYVSEPEKTIELTKEAEMPFEPLKSEDLALVNRLLQAQPDLRDTILIIRQVSGKAKYPIASFDDLANALGGESATVTFRGRTLTMAEARAVIPSYYFPIASESDLTAKVADLAKALPQVTATGAPTAITAVWAQEIPRNEALTPPSVVARTPPGRPGTGVLKIHE